jgi:hypothetical protein
MKIQIWVLFWNPRNLFRIHWINYYIKYLFKRKTKQRGTLRIRVFFILHCITIWLLQKSFIWISFCRKCENPASVSKVKPCGILLVNFKREILREWLWREKTLPFEAQNTNIFWWIRGSNNTNFNGSRIDKIRRDDIIGKRS